MKLPKMKRDTWIVIGGAAAAATAVIAIANFNKTPQATAGTSDTGGIPAGDQLLQGSQDELLNSLSRLTDALNMNAHNATPSDVGPGALTPAPTTPGSPSPMPVVMPVATPAPVTKPPVVIPERITLTAPLVTHATGGTGIIPAGATIQKVNGVPISLSPWAIAHGITL